MACWVLPNVAAEMWGVPVEHVMSRIDMGGIATRQEYGVLLVDVEPLNDLALSPPVEEATIVPEATPAVEPVIESAIPVLLSDGEIAALHNPTTVAPTLMPRVRNVRRIRSPRRTPVVEAPVEVAAPVETAVADSEDGLLDEPDDGKPMNWREVRMRVGRTRRPPPRF